MFKLVVMEILLVDYMSDILPLVFMLCFFLYVGLLVNQIEVDGGWIHCSFTVANNCLIASSLDGFV